MQIGKEEIIYSIAATFSIVLWAFFLNASSVTVQSLVSFARLGENITNLTSINFVLFLLLFPITYALIIALCKRKEKRVVQLISLISIAAGYLISLIVFSNLLNYAIVAIFYFASIFLVIEIASIRFKELKKFVIFRTAADSVSKGVLLLGVGLFVLSSLIILPEQKSYSSEFEDGMLSAITGGYTNEDYAAMSADLLINAEKQQLDLIMQSSEYQKLTTKDDEDAKEFVLMMNSRERTLNSNEYRQELIRQVTGQLTESADGGETKNVIEMMKQKSPILSFAEQFFWLFESFFLMSMFFLIGKIILGPLTIIYGLVLDKIIPKTEEIE